MPKIILYSWRKFYRITVTGSDESLSEPNGTAISASIEEEISPQAGDVLFRHLSHSGYREALARQGLTVGEGGRLK